MASKFAADGWQLAHLVRETVECDRVRASDLGGIAPEVHLHGEIAGAAVHIRALTARRRGTQVRQIGDTVAIGIRRRWRRGWRLDACYGRRSHGYRRRRRLAAEACHEGKRVQITAETIVGVILIDPFGDHAHVLVAEHDHRAIASAVALITELERSGN